MNQAVTSIMTLFVKELMALCSTISKLGKHNISKSWVMLSILAFNQRTDVIMCAKSSFLKNWTSNQVR